MTVPKESLLDCVLFDLDGLLVDSEPLQFRAYRYAFARFGIELGKADWIRWHGAESSTRSWVESERLDVDVEELRDTKQAYYEELIATELRLKPGAASLVEDCATQFELALVSASRRESIEACLARFELRPHFSVLVSGSEGARSKPFADPYLAALQRLDSVPERALALEDSVTGLGAARAAGLPCVICPDHYIPKADGAFDDAILVTPSLERLTSDRLRRIHAGAHHGEPQPADSG